MKLTRSGVLIRRWAVLVILMYLFVESGSLRNISDEARKRKASVIQQLMKKYDKKEGTLRLVGGTDGLEGNVEVLHMGKWGAVCDDEWGSQEAAVVCRQLGLGAHISYTHSGKYGLATRKYWMDNIYCEGSESNLTDCRFDGWGASDCSLEEAAGVVCRDPRADAVDSVSERPEELRVVKPPKTAIRSIPRGEEIGVRLRGGRSYDEGRVEIKYGDRWGVVCGDGFSLLEAMVICRQLGLGYAENALQTNFFGGNTSSILLSGLECRGTEDSIINCLHDRVGDVTCPGIQNNFAAVTCIKVMADLVIDHYELMRTAHLEDRLLMNLQCAMEENCLASQAYQIKRDQIDWISESRRLLRFTASVLNSGTADFRPAIPKHLWEWHMCHMHYHSMEVFATFDVMDMSGRRVAEGHKASFCLEDNTCLPGVEPKYACANYGDQGVSMNCSDIYRFNIDCQWVDISELLPGQYTLKVAVNPEFKVAEMTFENNAAVCQMLYTETFASVYDCVVQRP